MRIDSGHANDSQVARIEYLEKKLLDRKITDDEQLELALLNLEPLHEVSQSEELLQGLLSTSPHHRLAKVWLAYVYIYEFMDRDSLQKAIDLCEDLLQGKASAEIQAAAHLLRAAALRDLGAESPVPDLLESINLAPTWIGNRQLLARLYEERGDRARAEDQLRRALEIGGSQPKSDDHARHLFEMLITARWSYRVENRLEDQLSKLTGTRGG